MKTPIQQNEITLNGVRYVLSVPFRSWVGDSGEQLSEGPFYESEPPSDKYQYMPDLAFLQGVTNEPMAMHVIWKRNGQ